MTPFGDVYRGRRVLVTGSTGFKGSWLTLWLEALGAKVEGLALPPEEPSHWSQLGLAARQHYVDVRDAPAVEAALHESEPEILFHLAAQALVPRAYQNPLETWSTNVMGLANVLDACRRTPSVKAIVVVTSDKCYENREWSWGYRETDRIGGHDPYSASKGAAELVAASYRKAFFEAPDAPLLATARAGNVIGGGDWSADRLIPDLVRAVADGRPLVIRSPSATRPWQHVLESLSGYLRLGQRLLDGKDAGAWNFGPDAEGNRTVSEVLAALKDHWSELEWTAAPACAWKESQLLYLDNAKAKGGLGWKPVWPLPQALAATAGWYRDYLETGRADSRAQLAAYVDQAARAEVGWACG